jgi:hypothetical protein
MINKPCANYYYVDISMGDLQFESRNVFVETRVVVMATMEVSLTLGDNVETSQVSVSVAILFNGIVCR